MHRQKGFSLIELLIVVAIILTIAAIALPSLLRARIAANDSAAASTLRTINSAEITYTTTYSQTGYASNLQLLGAGASAVNCATTAPSSTAACLVDNVVGCTAVSCIKGGYEYFIVSSASSAPYGDYTASATPLQMGQTGSRNWCSNADSVVRMSPVNGTKLTNGETQSGCGDTTKYSAANFS